LSYKNGEEQSVPAQKIMSVLAKYKAHNSEDYLDVILPDGDVTIYMDSSSDKVSSMMISRPIKSKFLDEIIYNVMQCGDFIFYAPDGEFPIVLNSGVTSNLPEGMLESLGEPRIAESLESFSCLLKEMYGQ